MTPTKTLHLLLIVTLLGMVPAVMAQESDAQVCIKAFEDRNGNGTLDTGEPFITKDVGVSLADANGIIVRTALLDDSPNASGGLVCFTQVASGQYTLRVASAAYAATTASDVVTTVTDSAIPQIFDVGMQRIVTTLPTPAALPGTLTPQAARYAVERIFVAVVAAVLAMAIMSAVGAFVYALIVRPRVVARAAAAATPAYRRTDTGMMPAVRPVSDPYAAPVPSDSLYASPAPLRPDTDEFPSVSVPGDEDTGQYRPPTL